MKNKSKILSIVGARPQFIKLSALSHLLRKEFEEIIVHTGQHYDNDMSEVFFLDLGINKPDYNLGVGSGSHGKQTGEMLTKLEEVMLKEKPNLVIIFGDTNSTLAGSLASSKLGIPTVHIEAGLRSHNRKMPEEINRVTADHLSDYLFAPNKEAKQNLVREGLGEKILVTGDIMVDSVLKNVEQASESSTVIGDLNLTGIEFYLLTLHRPYNVDDAKRLRFIFEELSKVEHQIVFPIHPRTKEKVSSASIDIPQNITVTKPLGYIDFLSLQKHAQKIITDSGGIQKEAYILEKPCITLRSETEWVETVKTGWNLLIDTSKDEPFADQVDAFEPAGAHKDLFGHNVGKVMFDEIRKILSTV
jgi:UDP-N-acetylglucosamine 2-epimerase